MSSPSAAVGAIASSAERPEHYWRSLLYFNIYRCVLALILTVTPMLFGGELPFGSANPILYKYVCGLYVLFSAGCFIAITSRIAGLQPTAHRPGRRGHRFIMPLMFASGGISSGLGLLLLASLAAGGLIGRGRLTLFHAALASIAVLLEHAFDVVTRDAHIAEFVQAGLLSIGYFATAWLAHALAQRTDRKRATRRAARRRPRQPRSGESAGDPGHAGRRAGRG